MSMEITIKGNATNTLTGATEMVVPVRGVRPHFRDESEVETDNAGMLRAVRARRLCFELTPLPFEVVPDGVAQDSRTYFDLVDLLYQRHVWITAFSDDLRRMMDDDYGLVTEAIIDLPIKVVLLEMDDFGADFEAGQNRMESIVLGSEGWW